MIATMERPNTGFSAYNRALEITWLAVIFLVPLFFNPQSYRIFVLNKASLLQFLVLAMLAFWVADWLLNRTGHKGQKKQSIFVSPLHLAILVFGLVAALSTVASITPAISFWGSYFRKAGLLTLACWILFFLIVAQQIRNRAQLLRAIYTLLLSSGVVSILGILQHFFPDVTPKVLQTSVVWGNRVFSTIGNPLFLSSFLAMVIPFNLALIVYSWSKRKEGKNTRILVGLVILLALQFWCLWLAQYSITILLYIIAPIVFIIVLGIVKRKKLLLSLGAACLIGLAIIAGLLLVPLLASSPSVENVKTGNLESTMPSEAIGLHTLADRVQYWQSTMEIFLKSPEVPFSNDRFHFLRKVIGYGPETFIVTFQLFFPEKLTSDYTHQSLLVDRPHNDYLYLATTVGLLGLMSFLAILAVFFYLCFRYLRRATRDIDKLLLIAMVAAMVQYMSDIFFNISTISPELVFWLMLAMASVIGRFIWNKEPARIELEEAAQSENGATSYVTRARFFVSLGCAAALIVVGTVIAIRPFLADMYLKKGLELQAKGNEQAIYAFDKATKIEPEEAMYWHFLGAYSYYVARHVREEPLKTEILSLATSAYHKAVELNHYVAFERYSLADFYTYWAETGAADKWPAALSLYDEASQLFPRNAVILDKWSLALIIKGDLDEAQTKLDYTASIDPEWAETSFLSGLLLAREGKNDEAALQIMAPIRNKSANLGYFIDLCTHLATYDMVRPLQNALDAYLPSAPKEWTGHAMLGVTSLFTGDLSKSLDELNSAMLLVPGKDVSSLFQAILKLPDISPPFKKALPSVAAEWRDKLAQSPERDTLLPELDQLISNPK
jgi:tetratricopeptide (TPR) repeat protein